MSEIICKYCQSENVRKYGKYKDTQYYYCNICKRKFSNPEAIPKILFFAFRCKRLFRVLHYLSGLAVGEGRWEMIGRRAGMLYCRLSKLAGVARCESKDIPKSTGESYGIPIATCGKSQTVSFSRRFLLSLYWRTCYSVSQTHEHGEMLCRI
jgi:hypothetical protein